MTAYDFIELEGLKNIIDEIINSGKPLDCDTVNRYNRIINA